jgi:hypothetical protein
LKPKSSKPLMSTTSSLAMPTQSIQKVPLTLETRLRTSSLEPAKSWADRVALAVLASNDGYKTVTYKRKDQLAKMSKSKVLTGRRVGNTAIKTVPRRLVCFVGRLDMDTTAESLTEYLAESGLIGAKCTRIQAKDGRTFKTAAFRVSCDPQYRDYFYHEESWPEGADLRDWVFNN